MASAPITCDQVTIPLSTLKKMRDAINDIGILDSRFGKDLEIASNKDKPYIIQRDGLIAAAESHRRAIYPHLLLLANAIERALPPHLSPS